MQDCIRRCGPSFTRGRSLWAQMRRVSAQLFARLGGARREFFTLPNTYEIFGLDFVVDEGGTAWLLEVGGTGTGIQNMPFSFCPSAVALSQPTQPFVTD